MRTRKAKRNRTKKRQRAICGCTAANGDPKTWFSQRFLATKAAADILGPEGKMWETYKCPRIRGGWHIATVRWDPWNKSDSNSPVEAK